MKPGFVDYRGYVISKDDYTIEELDDIRNELTVKPIINTEYGGDIEAYPIYRESKNRLYLPRFYGIDKVGKPLYNKFDIIADKTNLNTTMVLRTYQTDIVKKTLESLNSVGGAMLALYTGSGKTSIAIYLMCELKVKTLILVHKSFLLQQWIERIKEFAPSAKIGIIQGAKIDVEDKDVVIGMLQSLSTKTYDTKLLAEFGLVIIDEVHHIGAEVFCRALPKVSSKYMIGLSATPNRKDGLTKVINWNIGPTAYKLERKGAQTVVVKRIIFDSDDEDYSTVHRNFRGTLMIPKMVNGICGYTVRNQLILSEIEQYIQEDKRQIMVISDRIAHLKALKIALDSRNIQIVRNTTNTTKTLVSGFYTGQQKQKELVISEKADVIFSTYSMTREGLDIQSLNTLIIATPTADVIQTCGRILRKTHDISPLIIDIVDNFACFIGQAKKREMFYKKSQYAIASYSYNGDEDNEEKITPIEELIKDSVIQKKKPGKDEDEGEDEGDNEKVKKKNVFVFED